MKKEVFLAISIGFILGLIITFGIWTANQSLKQVPTNISSTPSPKVAQTTGAPEPTKSPENKISLNISSPIDELLTNSDSVVVTGKTVPNASVAILFESGETLISATDTGDFTFDVPLDGGYNRIIIKAIDQKGDSSTQNLTVTYTTQKI